MLRIRLTTTLDEATPRLIATRIIVNAPLGVGYVRLFEREPLIRRGPHTVAISWTDRERRRVRRLPVAILSGPDGLDRPEAAPEAQGIYAAFWTFPDLRHRVQT